MTGRKVNLQEMSEDEKVLRLERLGCGKDQITSVKAIMTGETWVLSAVERSFLCALGHGWELEYRVLGKRRWARFVDEAQLARFASWEMTQDVYSYCEKEVSAFKTGLDLDAWAVALYRLTALLDPTCPAPSLTAPFILLMQSFILPYKQQATLPTPRFIHSEPFGEVLHLYLSPLTLLFNLFQADGCLHPDGFEKLCKEFDLCPSLVSVTTINRILAETVRDTNRNIPTIKHLALTLAKIALEAPNSSTFLTPTARLENLIRTYFSPKRGLGKTLNLPEVTTYEVPMPTVTTITPTRITNTGGTCTLTGFNLGILQLGVYVVLQWGQHTPDTVFSFPDMEPCETIKLEIPAIPEELSFEGLYVESRILEDQRVVVSFASLLHARVLVHNSSEACVRNTEAEGVVLEVGKQLGDTTLGPQISTFMKSLFEAAGETTKYALTYGEWKMISSKFNIPSFADQPFNALCGPDRTLTFKQFVSLLGHTARLMDSGADLPEVLNSWFTPGQASKLYQAAVQSFTSTKRKSVVCLGQGQGQGQGEQGQGQEDELEASRVLEEGNEGLLPDLMLSKLRRASSVLQMIKLDMPESPSALSPLQASPSPSRTQTFKTSAQLNELTALLDVLALEVSDINSSETELQAQLMKTREEAKHMAKSSRSKDDALRRTEFQKAVKVEAARKNIESLKESLGQRDELLKDWNTCCKELLHDLHEMEQWCDMFLSQSVLENPHTRNSALAEKYLESLKTISEKGKQKIRDLSRNTLEATGERRQTRASVAQGEEYIKLYGSIREDIRQYGEQLLQQVKLEKERTLREMATEKKDALEKTEQRFLKKIQENQEAAEREVQVWKDKAAGLEAALKNIKMEFEEEEAKVALLKDKLLHSEKLYLDEKEARTLENKIKIQHKKEKAEQELVPATIVVKLRAELTETREKVKEVTKALEQRSLEAHAAKVELTTSDSLRLKAEVTCDDLRRKLAAHEEELKMLRLAAPGHATKKTKKRSRAASVSPLPRRESASEYYGIRKVSIVGEDATNEDKGLSHALELERKENAVLRRLLQSKTGAESCANISSDKLKLALREIISEETTEAPVQISRMSSASLISRTSSVTDHNTGLLKSIIKNTIQHLKHSDSEEWAPGVTKEEGHKNKEKEPDVSKRMTRVFEIRGGVTQLGVNWRGDGDGFTIADVAPGSIAAEIGMVPGMKLLDVNGKRVNSTSGLQRAIKALASSDTSTWQFCAELREVEAVSPALHSTNSPFSGPSSVTKAAVDSIAKQLRGVRADLKALPAFIKKQHAAMAAFLRDELNNLLALAQRQMYLVQNVQDVSGMLEEIPEVLGEQESHDAMSPFEARLMQAGEEEENEGKGRLSKSVDISDLVGKTRDIIQEQAKSLERIMQNEEDARKAEKREFFRLVGHRIKLRVCQRKGGSNAMYYSVLVKNSELEMEKWAQKKEDARQKLSELIECQELAIVAVSAGCKSKVVSFKSDGGTPSSEPQTPGPLLGLKRLSEWVSPATVQKTVKALENKNQRLLYRVAQLTRQMRKKGSLSSADSIGSSTPLEGMQDEVLVGSSVLAGGPRSRRPSTLEGSECMDLVNHLKASRAKQEQQKQPALIVRRRLVYGKADEPEEEEKKAMIPKVPSAKLPPKPRPVPQPMQVYEDAQAMFNRLIGAPVPSPRQGFKAPLRKPVKTTTSSVYEPIAFTKQSNPQNAFKMLSVEPQALPVAHRPGTTEKKVSNVNKLIRDEITYRQSRTR